MINERSRGKGNKPVAFGRLGKGTKHEAALYRCRDSDLKGTWMRPDRTGHGQSLETEMAGRCGMLYGTCTDSNLIKS